MVEIFNSIADGMGAVLAFLYSAVSNYGVAIIGLTVLVRLALFPLTAKQARSMQKMQLIQPEIKKIQAQYKNDRQKLNEEIMKFYKENKINPMAGCLPLLLQMPIFFALFRVLSEPQDHIPRDSTLFKALCGGLNPGDCDGHTRALRFLGMDLSEAASRVSGGFMDTLPYFLLIALVVVTGYLQFKQTQSRQSGQVNPQMAMMGKIFPVMFAFISYSMPSGVVLYFLVSNAWQIGQQALIFRTLPTPPPGAGGTVAASGSTPRPTGKPGNAAPKSDKAPEAPPEGRFKRALGQARDAGQTPREADQTKPAPKPAPKRPPGAGGGRPADGGLGRAQPSGSKPQPKKRRK